MNRQYPVPEIKNGIKVLGVKFQAFIDPETKQAVFSQSGVARGLQIPRHSAATILKSHQFKALRGSAFSPPRILTEVNSQPISVVTQADLVLLVQIAAEKGYPIANSMQEASFAVLLQQSVDEALNTSRSRKEYLDAGASLRQKLEYRYSYHSMKEVTIKGGHGVRTLCRINRQVSSLAVPDADQRRTANSSWRKNCSAVETVKITIGNTVHERAVEASIRSTLKINLDKAAERTASIYGLLDAPF